MSTTKRVAKNSTFLSVRMVLGIFISLYSTRLILNSLGAADFGIFNVIGGSIAMLGFLNGVLAYATQCFMSMAEGEGNEAKKLATFNVAVALHLIIGAVTIALLLGAMPWLFSHVLNIEPERVHAAHIIYFCLIASTFFTVINAPYEGVLNAHENMLFYSITGVLESVLKLAVALVIVHTSADKLILYGYLMTGIPLAIFLVTRTYCRRRYTECALRLRGCWDWKLMRRIAAFSGWNLLTGIANLCSYQGMGIVLNHFFGTLLNAAQGVANQVNGQLSAFSINIMRSLNPVIIKKTAANETESMNAVTLAGCKFSTYFLLLFAVPVTVQMRPILELWLKEVPEWTVLYCNMQLLLTATTMITQPVATAIYATARIRTFSILKSILSILPLPVAYVCFHTGFGPGWLYVPMLVCIGLGVNVVILLTARRECGLSLRAFVTDVIAPVAFTAALMFGLGLLSHAVHAPSLGLIALCTLLTTTGIALSLATFGLKKSEKTIIRTALAKALNRRQK